MPQIVQVADPMWVSRALSAREARVADTALFMPDPSNPLLSRTGVLVGSAVASPNGRLSVAATTPSASMAVVVSAGVGISSRSGQGAWIVPVETPVTVDVPTADGSNPRIDIVVLRVYDLDAGDTIPPAILAGLPANQRGCATVEVIDGAPSAIPVVPSTPAGAIKLCELAVTALQPTIVGGNISLKRKSAGLRGAVRYFLEGDTVGDPGTYDGELRFTSSDFERWDDAAMLWRPLSARGRIGGRTITGAGNLGAAITTVETQPTNMNSGLLSLAANRAYDIRVRYKVNSDTSGDGWLMRVKVDSVATGTTGTQLREVTHRTDPDISIDGTVDLWAEYETGGVAESKAFKLTCARQTAGGSLQFIGGGAGTTNVVGVSVYDVGPAGRNTVTAS